MSKPSSPPLALPITAITWSPVADDDEIRTALVAAWGPIAGESASYGFDAHTHYYAEEMGTGLMKRLVAFADPMSPGDLADRKREANELELRWQDDAGRRTVNVDPGYLTPSLLVLASAKHSGRRVYLSDGIYSEITLWFEGGSYRSLPWTYSDFRQDMVIETLGAWRPQALVLLEAWKKARS